MEVIQVVRLVETRYEEALWARIIDLRLRVYVKEQGVTIPEELDGLDPVALHWAALVDDRVVGTARLLLGDDEAKFGRLAVEPTHRRGGIATLLLEAAVARARAAGVRRVTLDAQTRVTALYEQLGFRAVGDVFLDARIDHIKMIRDL